MHALICKQSLPAQVNDQYIKVAKLKGEFVWHAHENEDECFHIIAGALKMQYEGGRVVQLVEGDVHVVPAGVRHNPLADEGECHVMLVETVSTAHTGDVVTKGTRSIQQQLGQQA
jgi:mannose-6-phosphate isomerase-like protein (cupin superfamily)